MSKSRPGLALVAIMACAFWLALVGRVPQRQAARADPGTTQSYLPVVIRLRLPLTPTTIPGRMLVSEVMVAPEGEEPDSEWIELYNAGDLELSLSGYKVGDAANIGDREGMFAFPVGASAAGEQVLVIANRANSFYDAYGFLPDFEFNESHPLVPNLDKYTAWAGGNVLLSNSGDEVFLLDPSNGIADALSWGSSPAAFDPAAPAPARGRSLERYPAGRDTDTASDWMVQSLPNPGTVSNPPPTPTPTRTPTPTFTPTPSSTATPFTPLPPGLTPTTTGTSTPIGSTPPAGKALILVSEVLYDPAGTGMEPAGEWIELYNAGEIGVNLAGYKLGDEETPGGYEGMLQFPAQASMTPGQVVLIAHQAETFRAQYGFLPDFEIENSDSSVPDLLKYPYWASGDVQLNNSGDEVLLLDGYDQLVDGLSWGSSQAILNPAVPSAPEGASLERYPADVDTDRAADWRSLFLPRPGEVALNPPAPTLTATASGTPTATTDPTRTATPTATHTALATGTPTASPTATTTGTATPTATATATATNTTTPTWLATSTATSTSTATATATTTSTTTATSTATATSTVTPTSTATGTATSTPTATVTTTATQTSTATQTATPLPLPVINEVHADPASVGGDANGDGVANLTEDEFLEIANLGTTPLDLSGWQVWDLIARQHTFPAGTQLMPGCAVVVFGGGTPTGSFGGSLVQTASTGSLMLTDSGDRITLRDRSGVIVRSYDYYGEGAADQSLTRDPDLTGPEPLVLHSTASGSGGARFSPGTRVDGSAFSGCGVHLERLKAIPHQITKQSGN